MVLVNVALALLNCLLARPSCLDPMGSCLNGGICIKQHKNKVPSTACLCSAGYGGEKCEKIVSVCDAYPHYCNAGTCVSVNGSAVCYCSLGYFGRNCEYVFDKCKLGNMCRNGGNCVDDICLCTDGFSGDLCERHVPERDDYLHAGCEEHPEFCALRFADGTCNKECNNEKCFFDGFDCVVSAQECSFADYCASHYLDGKCDENCAVAECGYDGMDCDRNRLDHDVTDRSAIGIIFKGSKTEILDKIYLLLAKLAQKLHNPVHLALDSNNRTRIYEWSFENGIGEEIDFGKRWEISRNMTGILLYVDIDPAFCEQRLHLNKTNVLPCFTDIFGAAAYLHTALYDEAKDRISLVDVAVEELFVENDRSRSLSMTVFITFFILGGITLSCLCGIYGFWDVLKKRNIEKNHAPVWEVPPLQSNGTNWSTVSSDEHNLSSKETCRSDGLPSQSRRSPSSSCKLKQLRNFMSHCQLVENTEQRILVNLDACFSDNGGTDCHLGLDLLKAVKCNDIKAVSFLVLHGADVNYSDSDKNTPLHHAVVANNDQIIRLLLSTHQCNLRAVNVLGQTPLTLTVKFAHVSDLCARCILDFMYTQYYQQITSLNGISAPQLTPSISQDDISQSTFLTSSSAEQCNTSLNHSGSCSDDCIFSRNILSEKDDPTLTDVFGRTALHYAALNKRINLLSVLYAFGLKLDTEDNKGETPLYLAAREGHLEAVDLLLSFGADNKLSDELGHTPLDIAKERGHHLVVKFLENLPINNADIIKTVKRKRRSRKPSSAARCKSKEGPQVQLSSSEETISLNPSNIAISLNEDYTEDVGNITDDATISSSVRDSTESFILTPPEQILTDAEEQLNLDIVSTGIPNYIDLATDSCLPSEFFHNSAFFMESFQCIDEMTAAFKIQTDEREKFASRDNLSKCDEFEC